MLSCGYLVYCPMIRSQRGLTINLDENDHDTIIGYGCEYPDCYEFICKLPIECPIGNSMRKVQQKSNNNH